MEFDTAIVAALIAAAATLVAARYMSRAAARQSKINKKAEFIFKSAEMAHQRKTELYAIAFEITGKLSKNIILVKGKAISKIYFDDIKGELLEWENKCGLIFDVGTLAAYRALLEALSAPAKDDGICHGKLRMMSGVSVRGFAVVSKLSSLARKTHCLH